jgi:DNA (cytosine-5)-methyltransferase 1
MIKVVDLFAGCGGLTEGFIQTGKFTTVAAVEWDKAAAETLKNRLTSKWQYADAENKILIFDIQRIDELLNGWKDYEYGEHVGLLELIGNRQLDLVIGGPPCQAYSIAGRIRDKQGMQNDYRNFLFESYIEVVKTLRPRAIIFENVLGILSAKPGGIPIIDRIADSFGEIDYAISSDIRKQSVIRMKEYGVPQNRERVILVGVDKRRYGARSDGLVNQFYEEILPKFKKTTERNVGEAISDLKKFIPKATPYKILNKRYSHKPHKSQTPNHIPRYHNLRDIQIFKKLAEDSLKENPKYTNSTELKRLYTETTGRVSNVHKYHVLKADRPSNTIVAHLHKDGLRHIHPDPQQARTITVREAARLQEFDDDFEFLSTQSNNYKMIGNAVPVGFANILAQAVYELLNN